MDKRNVEINDLFETYPLRNNLMDSAHPMHACKDYHANEPWNNQIHIRVHGANSSHQGLNVVSKAMA